MKPVTDPIQPAQAADALAAATAATDGALSRRHLMVAAAAFRTFSDLMYRRNRPLVFALTTESATTPRKSTTSPLLQAILLLIALGIIAAVIGGQSSPS